MPRQPNGRPSIYKGADGDYHSYVTVGHKPNGKLDRRHVRGKTATDVASGIEALLERVARGNGAPVKIETLEHWLLHWVDQIVKPRRAWKTWKGYRSIITTHLIPELGHRRLDGSRNRLEPEHVEAMYAKLGERLAPHYVLNIHRCLRRALRVAVRRGRASRNVCDLIDPPESRPIKIKPLSLAEAQAVIREALADPLSARWLLALLLGPRQGEALGLRWFRVHLDPPGGDDAYIELLKQSQRRTWEHGCADPVACVRNRTKDGKPASQCRTKPCPQWDHGCEDPAACSRNRSDKCPQRRPRTVCRTHRGRDGCPPLCKPNCTRHASSCPQRHGGGLVEADLKSYRSERPLALGDVLTEQFRTHREAQIKAFADAGVEWSDQGHVFVGPDLRPIDPRRDHGAWEALLARAGVSDARLHAARHTAGTMAVATGTKIEELQEILGHASVATTRIYVEVAKKLKRDAVDRVAAALLEGSLTALLQPNNATARLDH